MATRAGWCSQDLSAIWESALCHYGEPQRGVVRDTFRSASTGRRILSFQSISQTMQIEMCPNTRRNTASTSPTAVSRMSTCPFDTMDISLR
jgi:hypothetical protein